MPVSYQHTSQCCCCCEEITESWDVDKSSPLFWSGCFRSALEFLRLINMGSAGCDRLKDGVSQPQSFPLISIRHSAPSPSSFTASLQLQMADGCMVMVTGVINCCLKTPQWWPDAGLFSTTDMFWMLGLVSVLWYYITDKILFIIHSGVLEVIRKFSPATKNRLVFSVSWIFICFNWLSSVTAKASSHCQEKYSFIDQESQVTDIQK